MGSIGLKADIDQDINLLREKKELVVALSNMDAPPFYMVSKNGNLIGLDIEIAKEISRILKVKLRFDRSAKTFDEVVDAVASGKADIAISMLSFTPQRGVSIIYTKPYFQLSKAALINRVHLEKAGAVSIKELLKPSTSPKPLIGVFKGSSYEVYARTTFPHIEIVSLENWDELVDKVRAGKLTVIFGDNNDIKMSIYKNPKIILEAMAVSLKDPDYLYIGYSKKYPSLPSWIDLIIENDYRFKINYEHLFDSYKKEIQDFK